MCGRLWAVFSSLTDETQKNTFADKQNTTQSVFFYAAVCIRIHGSKIKFVLKKKHQKTVLQKMKRGWRVERAASDCITRESCNAEALREHRSSTHTKMNRVHNREGEKSCSLHKVKPTQPTTDASRQQTRAAKRAPSAQRHNRPTTRRGTHRPAMRIKALHENFSNKRSYG